MTAKNLTNPNPVEEEKAAEQEAEVLASRQNEPSAEEAASLDPEAEKALAVEEGTKAEAAVPAEVAALHPEEIPEEPKSKLERRKAKKTARSGERQAKIKATEAELERKKRGRRSKHYLEIKKLIEPGKFYPLAEALRLVKQVSLSKFDGAVELHLNLAVKKSKSGSESPRGIVHLPHGSPIKKKIVILDEEKIERISQTKKVDFDLALAPPSLMPKVAKIARILGPLGKMPDPKAGTVTESPETIIEEINSGRTEYRLDSTNNLHQPIGRVSWPEQKLEENAAAILKLFPRSRITKATLSPTIGPGVPLEVK